MKTYVLASSTEWALSVFLKRRPKLPGRWFTVCTPEDLEDLVANLDIKVRYIFFPHWSSIVPAVITQAFECIAFHMTDLPYGRGGSPLQNLIANGATKTKITAFK